MLAKEARILSEAFLDGAPDIYCAKVNEKIKESAIKGYTYIEIDGDLSKNQIDYFESLDYLVIPPVFGRPSLQIGTLIQW